MRRLLIVLLAGLLLAAGLDACAKKKPEKVVHFKVKNSSDHPVKVSYYFFIRTTYRLEPLLDRLEPGDVSAAEIGGSLGNPTFVLIAEALDDYRPKAWYKLVGRMVWDEGRTFEIMNRHVEPPGAEGGAFPDPRRSADTEESTPAPLPSRRVAPSKKPGRQPAKATGKPSAGIASRPPTSSPTASPG